MTKNLTGIPSLSYLGVNAGSPPNIRMYDRAPTVNDWQNFIVGDIWINITPTPATSREVYMLVALLRNQATWVFLYDGTGGNVLTSLIDDSGNIVTPLAGSITINGGANINTDGSVPHIIKVNLNTSIWQPATTADQLSGVYGLGGVAFLHGFGIGNTFTGTGAGNFTLTGSTNSCYGNISGSTLGSGSGNCFFGTLSGLQITSGSNNCLYGQFSGSSLLTGSNLVLVGAYAGNNYASSESSNIAIGYHCDGIIGESNTLRIGNATGTAAGNLANDYIAGIYNTAAGVAYLGTSPKMVAIGSDGKITSSPNIYMPATTATTGQVIQGTTPILHTYTQVGVGAPNLFIGNNAGNFTTTAHGSIGIGINSLSSMDTTAAPNDAEQNTAVGVGAMSLCTSGGFNTAIGCQSLEFLLDGDCNTCLGNGAGYHYAGSESGNILIGSNVYGTLGESNVLQIGVATGVATANLNKAYICGITGRTVGGSGVAVFIDNNDQLGTVVSSIRYKENVKDISDVSDIISKLRPVEFNYKEQPFIPQYGLIAEEVEPVWPEMMVYDKEGQPETVKYQHLPIILLKEIQSLRKRIEELEKK